MGFIRSQARIYRDVFFWIKSPKDKPLNASIWRKLRISTSLVLFSFAFSFVVILPLLYFVDRYLVAVSPALEPFSKLELVALTVVGGPLFEELFLRYLLPYKRNYPAKAVNALSKGWVLRHWSLLFKIIVYLSALVFGLVHITNYGNIDAKLLLASPVIIGSQLVGGLTLAYTRVRLGFVWALGEHVVFNSVLIAFALIFSHNSIVLRQYEEAYSVDVRYLEYIDANDTSLDYTIENGIVYQIIANDYDMQSLLDEVGFDAIRLRGNFWADFSFESESGIELSTLESLLEDGLVTRPE